MFESWVSSPVKVSPSRTTPSRSQAPKYPLFTSTVAIFWAYSPPLALTRSSVPISQALKSVMHCSLLPAIHVFLPSTYVGSSCLYYLRSTRSAFSLLGYQHFMFWLIFIHFVHLSGMSHFDWDAHLARVLHSILGCLFTRSYAQLPSC